jgi:hypothetical protein
MEDGSLWLTAELRPASLKPVFFGYLPLDLDHYRPLRPPSTGSAMPVV